MNLAGLLGNTAFYQQRGGGPSMQQLMGAPVGPASFRVQGRGPVGGGGGGMIQPRDDTGAAIAGAGEAFASALEAKRARDEKEAKQAEMKKRADSLRAGLFNMNGRNRYGVEPAVADMVRGMDDAWVLQNAPGLISEAAKARGEAGEEARAVRQAQQSILGNDALFRNEASSSRPQDMSEVRVPKGFSAQPLPPVREGGPQGMGLLALAETDPQKALERSEAAAGAAPATRTVITGPNTNQQQALNAITGKFEPVGQEGYIRDPIMTQQDTRPDGSTVTRAMSRESVLQAVEGDQVGQVPGTPLGSKNASTAEAGQRASITSAYQDLDIAASIYFPEGLDGEFNRRRAIQEVLSPDGFARAKQAERRALEALLRARTGAAAPDSEVDNYQSMYGINPTDSVEVARDKYRSMRTFFDTFGKVAGMGANQFQSAIDQKAAETGQSVDWVLEQLSAKNGTPLETLKNRYRR